MLEPQGYVVESDLRSVSMQMYVDALMLWFGTWDVSELEFGTIAFFVWLTQCNFFLTALVVFLHMILCL